LRNCSHHDSGKVNLKADDRLVGHFVGLEDSIGSRLAIPENKTMTHEYTIHKYTNVTK